MKNHKNNDNISKNIISAPNEIISSSKTNNENAGKAPFCIYAGLRHQVGSIIIKEDGSKLVCTENGSWQNLE